MLVAQALAELKLIKKKLEAHRDNATKYVMRDAIMADPLTTIEGGSAAYVAAQRQAFSDLSDRYIRIKSAIDHINQQEVLAVGGMRRTVYDWLAWRREMAPFEKQLLAVLRQTIDRGRQEMGRMAQQRQAQGQPANLVVNLDEAELNAEIMTVEQILSELDSALSVFNATHEIII